MEYEVRASCHAAEKWRRATLSAALGAASALLLSPWLEAVLLPSAALFAASFQILACNREKKITVRREVQVKEKRALVTVSAPPGTYIKDYPSAPPVSGSPEGFERVTYVIDLDLNPFVFWPGTYLKVKEGQCECTAFLSLNEVVSSWSLEGLGLGEPVEVEGGDFAVPEVEGVREYAPGDDPRLVVWKTLYSPGGLRVKELKKVREVVGLKKGVATFTLDIGPWEDNPCMKAFAENLAKYLEGVGMKRVSGRADVAVLAPGGKGEAELYLLLNPLACLPSVEGFDALELVREEVLREYLATEKALKERGEVRGVPWSVPPRRTDWLR
ncbi:DUF58 domain-containing protein [Ignicoccus hospitalis]|uniref:Uncharacterized protein n=1 Tax=Ignicoccus hospitalis (strain KIN4/I / DSM 18386 / JCM 14125) TaxID=453591 RepID=A8AA83_IGNH4|nr:DUF58 domain-containing protein [Ignicoccus hospitalis]ABU81835.1 hypothetical protein Igni_0653 [Ignicoccus hospitalis KIN4/I]HIH90104.1 DUF58 domain-containing protein [Desulfurococcaceae archaeon]